MNCFAPICIGQALVATAVTKSKNGAKQWLWKRRKHKKRIELDIAGSPEECLIERAGRGDLTQSVGKQRVQWEERIPPPSQEYSFVIVVPAQSQLNDGATADQP